MSNDAPEFIPDDIPPGTKVAIVAARFNSVVVDELMNGCLARLTELGVNQDQITTDHVPGAFELPLAAQSLARTRRFAAVICLGAVIRGETPHFDFVAGECARGIMDASLSTGVPIIFGVLTTNNDQQAQDRIGGAHGHAGRRAAEAALEMIGVLHRAQTAGQMASQTDPTRRRNII